MGDIGFKKRQQKAYDTLVAGKNLFLTGDAGTGKSFVIQKFIEYCVKKKKQIIVTAPTGIAALNIDGVTIHRAFKAPIGPIVEDIKSVSKILKDSDVVIVDEISMCRIDLFEYMIKQIVYANKYRRKNCKVDIQLVVVGDFFQLPPVTLPGEKDILERYYQRKIGYGFAFQSEYWEACGFINVVLDEVVRQSEIEFIEALNGTRLGKVSALNYFIRNSSDKAIKNAIFLCGTNKAVKEKNRVEFEKIQNEKVEYESRITGEVKESDKVVPDLLELKVGARVMTLINDTKDRFRNGSFGEIIELNDETIKVVIDDGPLVELERNTWEIMGYDIEKDERGKARLVKTLIGSYTQFPVKLAYAITIHKSQGQTYECVNLDPYCWDCGQLYVALSRCKNVKTLFIENKIKPSFLMVSDEVLDFYSKL